MQGVMLCGKPGGKCCPVLSKKGRKYTLSDKGQIVSFTKEQLKLLGNVIKKVVD